MEKRIRHVDINGRDVVVQITDKKYKEIMDKHTGPYPANIRNGAISEMLTYKVEEKAD